MQSREDEDIDIFQHEGYLEARLTGVFQWAPFRQQAAFIVRACKDRATTRLLVDLLSMAGFEDLGITDRYQLGLETAQNFQGRVRVAIVGKTAQFDPQQFGATVAQNRGTQLRLFTDRDEAVRWLTSSDPAGRGPNGRSSSG